MNPTEQKFMDQLEIMRVTTLVSTRHSQEKKKGIFAFGGKKTIAHIGKSTVRADDALKQVQQCSAKAERLFKNNPEQLKLAKGLIGAIAKDLGFSERKMLDLTKSKPTPAQKARLKKLDTIFKKCQS